jgi:hypothetical protein
MPDVAIVADFRLERKILNGETYEVKQEFRNLYCRLICDPTAGYSACR